MSTAVLLLLSAGLVASHEAIWTPSMYGWNAGGNYDPVTPLSNLPFEQWWFHGYAQDEPSEVTELPAGGQVMLEIACNRDYTSYGSQTSDSSSSMSACPVDAGSYHATQSGDGWTDVLGCALAMADSNDVNAVQPEDFVVFSVNQQCVTQRETYFDVPNSMPECSHDWCLCTWHWGGANSQDEMYQIGFKCKPTGAPSGTKLLAAGQGNAKNPWYWANQGHQNYDTAEWGEKPSYLDRSNFTNGAQESISTSAAANGGSDGSPGIQVSASLSIGLGLGGGSETQPQTQTQQASAAATTVAREVPLTNEGVQKHKDASSTCSKLKRRQKHGRRSHDYRFQGFSGHMKR